MSSIGSLLLVEDDDDLRAIFQRRLERRGFAVTAVASPQAALQAITHRRFHIAVVDRSLPPPGGFGLVEELRRVDSALRIVMMSGSPAEEWVAAAARLGAAACLVKPFALAELDDAVQREKRIPEPV